MDEVTIKKYDDLAVEFAQEWLEQETPLEIHNIVTRYFQLGAATADIGSGSGREVAWLNKNGFPAVGYDASEGLIDFASNKFPEYQFLKAELPLLNEIKDHAFSQVLCETVLMHLPRHLHLESFKNLLRIIKPAGVLSMSWRVPSGTLMEERDQRDRLYTRVDGTSLKKWALEQGHSCLLEERIVSTSSGKIIEQMVFQTKS